jgi:sporulation protein YlmC with PRC-barrel domain
VGSNPAGGITKSFFPHQQLHRNRIKPTSVALAKYCQKTVLTGLSVIATDISVHAAGNKVGVTKDQMKTITRGWSVKDKIMGKSVYNENKEKIGTIDDLIVTSDRSLSYAIVGVGGFLGMGKHDVAIPMSQLKADQDGFVLPGATKDALKAMPEYAKS